MTYIYAIGPKELSLQVNIMLLIFKQIQFVTVISQNMYALITDCDFDKRVELSCVVYLSSLFLLFSNFFIQSYLKPKGFSKGQERLRGQRPGDATTDGDLLSEKGVTTTGPRQRTVRKES